MGAILCELFMFSLNIILISDIGNLLIKELLRLVNEKR